MKAKRIIVLLLIAICIALVFSACSNDYVKVTFYVDGVELVSYFVDKDGALDEIPEVPTKEGMNGVWSVEDFDEISKDLRVDAIYESNSYTVTFLADGVVVKTVSVNKKNTISALPEVPKKAGYEGEWNITDFSTVRRDINVTAIYTPILYSVNFFLDSGVPYTTRYLESGGGLADIPAVPAYNDKNYTGKWMLKTGEETTPVYTEPKFSELKQSTDLYARYFVSLQLKNIVRETTIDFDFDLEQGEITVDADVLTQGEIRGNDFLGWYLDDNFRQKVNFPAEFNGNQTLYARWVDIRGSEGFTFLGNKVTGYAGEEEEVVIPYKNGDTIITEIADNAFREAVFTKITLPSTITKIGANSFLGCENLIEVKFADADNTDDIIKYFDSNNIIEIGSSAFLGATALKSYEFSDWTTTIGENAFAGCYSLKDLINLENTELSVINSQTFYMCESVEHINLPPTLTTIASRAFARAINAEFSFADITNLTEIGAEAFRDCAKLIEINAPNLQYIAEGAFSNCRSLNTVTMLSINKLYKLFGTTCDDTQRFYALTDLLDSQTNYVPLSLRNVVIVGSKLNGEETLISYALYNCHTVKNITFASGVKVIQKHAFYRDSLLTVSGDISLNLPLNLERIEEEAFISRTDIVYVSLPRTLESIGEKAFFELNRLSVVTVAGNSSLVSVGKNAFRGTEWYRLASGLVSLGRIVIGVSEQFALETLVESNFEGRDTIEAYAFEGQTTIKSVTLGSNILKIGDYAFENCTNLAQIGISPSTKEIGEGILSGCRSFSSLKVGGSTNIPSLFGTRSYDGSYERESYYLPISWTKLSIVLDSAQTQITEGVFNNYIKLTEITIGEGYTSVLDSAFSGNTSLLKINFPSSLLEIGAVRLVEGVEQTNEGVFAYCANLQEVSFAENSLLQYIRNSAFKNTALKSFTVGKKVMLIEKEAFSGTKLQTLLFEDNSTAEFSLIIEEYAFSGITTFNTDFVLKMPIQLVACGEGAFSGNTNLRNVTLNSRLVSIGTDCFKNCDLRSFDLVSSVLLYEDEQSNLAEKCLVNNMLSGNNNLAWLTLHNGIELRLLFESVPANLTKISVLGGEIIAEQFQNCTNIQILELRNITGIGDFAFANCNNANFKRVNIPETVTFIGDYAFSGCTYLSSFNFLGTPQISSIGVYLFSGNSSLLEVTFPPSVQNTSLEGVFMGCERISKANIPFSVTEIGDYTFYNAKNLQSISIPQNIVNIGDYAFANCEKMQLTNISFSSLESIGESAFSNCQLLRGIKAENIVSIGSGAFDNCSVISEITIVNEAVSYYLSNVESIVSVNVSKMATTFADSSFGGCTNLRMLIVHSQSNIEGMLSALSGQNLGGDVKIFVDELSYSNLSEEIKNSSLFDSIYPNPCQFVSASYSYDESNFTATLVSAVYDKAVAFLPTFVYKDNVRYAVTKIGDSVFKNNSILKQIIIPYTVQTIGKYAFQNCTELQSVVVETGSKLQTIDNYAFYRCAKLASFSLPNSVKYINTYAFSECSALATFEITYGSELVSIGSYAFSKTSNLQNFKIKNMLNELGEYCFIYSGISSFSFGNMATYSYDENNFTATLINSTYDEAVAFLPAYVYKEGVLYTVTKIGDSVFKDNSTLVQVIVPCTIKVIGKNAFQNCSNLVSVLVENVSELVTIESNAFYKCTKLSSFSLPKSVTEINSYAFSECSAMTTFIIEDGSNLITIGSNAFYKCTKLSSFSLPKSVTEINSYAFSECSAMTTFIIEDGSNLITIGSNAFYKCTKLSSFSLPKSVTEINSYAFSECSAMTTFIIDDGSNLITIGSNAFYKCTKLSSFSLPKSVTEINSYAFSECSAMTTFIIEDGSNLITIDSNAFYKCAKLDSFSLPKSVTEINSYAFSECSELVIFEIEDTSELIHIGDYAFANCVKMQLTNISFSSLESIGESAFSNCQLLRGIKAENIVSIGSGAFDNCSVISEITIVNEAVSYYLSNVESIVSVNVSKMATTFADSSFGGCTNLRMLIVHSQSNIEGMLSALSGQNLGGDVKIFVDELSYSNLSEEIKNSTLFDSIYPNPCQFVSASYSYDESNFTATLVSAVYDKAVAFLPTFVYKDNVRYTVTKIDDSVFKNNSILQQIIIPYTVQTIGKYAFQNCTELQSVVVETGSKLQTIDNYAFYRCVKLASFSLPNSVKYINTYAFSECSALATFEITYGSELVSIGSYAFSKTSSLQGFAIKSALNSLGAYSFSYSGINSFSFGEIASLSVIAEYTFGYCENLNEEDVIIPESVIEVAENAFKKDIY